MTTWDDLLKPGEANDFFTRNFPPFEPDATTYSRANALWLAELCRLVYRNGDRNQFLARGGLVEVKPFDKKGTEAFLVRSVRGPSFAALVFRGTDDLEAWITDLKAWKTPLKDGAAVHEGFEEAIEPVWTDIQQAIANVEDPLFFSGHSLGAALATIAAARLAATRPPRALYTFGSPFVGNRAFVASLPRIPIFRVDDAHDIVPTVPPEELGYTHVGELHQLKEPKEIFKFDPLEAFRKLVGPLPFLADHAPINYVNRI